MAQLISITSEALQATIRRLLPSQQGFGEDLQASNVVTPIIDLTPTAEGSQLPSYLQQALSFGAVTRTFINGGNSNIATTPGFYRLFGQTSADLGATVTANATISLQDGLGQKNIYSVQYAETTNGEVWVDSFDFVVFLDTNEFVNAAAGSDLEMNVSVIQLADRYGNLQNPSGFTFE